ARENVALGLRLAGADDAHAASDRALAAFGLGGRGGQRAGTLSGGEQQRVAIAAAAARQAPLVLADEPTAELDERNEALVLEALGGRSGSGKTTLLHVLGGLVEPTAGTVEWHGRPHGITYVFQGANLLPTFTTFENVAFATHIARAAAAPPLELLALVGLEEKA